MPSDWLDVFPVAGPKYGYQRAFGPHHKGTDIFADKGTPVVAVVTGFARSFTEKPGGKGGLTVYLESQDDGPPRKFYYAHLDSYAFNMSASGVEVLAGDELGFVGQTGNAANTPPHLHFQMQLTGQQPVDPFDELVKVDPLLGGGPKPDDDPNVPPLPAPTGIDIDLTTQGYITRFAVGALLFWLFFKKGKSHA